METNYRPKNTTNLLTVGLIVVISLVGGQTSRAKEKTESVIVQNTTAQPVPTTVQNEVATRSADNPAFQPYQIQISTAACPGGSCVFASFDVPAGKRFIIELVTMWIALDQGQKIEEILLGVNDTKNAPVYHELTPTGGGQSSTGGHPVFFVTQPLRLYCEAGSATGSMNVTRNASSGFIELRATLSGYLVDLP